jgi:hypothetical protein
MVVELYGVFVIAVEKQMAFRNTFVTEFFEGTRHKFLADSLLPERLINCYMVYISPTAIVTAKNRTDDPFINLTYKTQTWLIFLLESASLNPIPGVFFQRVIICS